jgi:chromosome segregation ATPase
VSWKRFTTSDSYNNHKGYQNMLKKANHAEMIDTCQGKLNACNAEIEQARLTIQNAHNELQEIEQRRAIRQREREQIMPHIQAAHRQLEEARAYASVASSAQSATQVVAREAEASKVQERFAVLQKRHLEDERSDTAQAAELHQAIRQAQSSLPSLETKIQALTTTREKLSSEQGEALYESLSAKLRDAEMEERNAQTEIMRAQVALAQMRAEAIEQLGRWPALKTQLIREHHAHSDASTKALTAYIGLLDILLQEGANIDNTPIAKPGTYSFLQEMVIKPEDLWPLNNRYTASALKERREKVAGLLKRYQAALTRE